MKVFFLIGITCSGKTTILNQMKQRHPDAIGLVQVGKEMRRRHPPEYFDGLGAMPKTEDEAWTIFEEQLKKCAGYRYVLVDGQPRMASQVQRCLMVPDHRFLWLSTMPSIIAARIESSDRTDAEKKLARERVHNDSKQLIDVMSLLDDFEERITYISNVEQLEHLMFGD
jgi:shikimate kinase